MIGYLGDEYESGEKATLAESIIAGVVIAFVIIVSILYQLQGG